MGWHIFISWVAIPRGGKHVRTISESGLDTDPFVGANRL